MSTPTKETAPVLCPDCGKPRVSGETITETMADFCWREYANPLVSSTRCHQDTIARLRSQLEAQRDALVAAERMRTLCIDSSCWRSAIVQAYDAAAARVAAANTGKAGR